MIDLLNIAIRALLVVMLTAFTFTVVVAAISAAVDVRARRADRAARRTLRTCEEWARFVRALQHSQEVNR